MAEANTATVQKIEEVIRKAVEKNASDVFLSSGARPSCRILGKVYFMEEYEAFTSDILGGYLEQITSPQEQEHMKNLNDLDFAMEIENVGRFRVHAFFQLGGISIVFRTIPLEIPGFDTLRLPPQLKNLAGYKNGLVLLTGAMGNGKSTTLASIIDMVNDSSQRHIVTIEDPIEFVHRNKKCLIEQRELESHTTGFASAIRSCLRQGADVILLGEMRDPETVAMALRAAETGALVFSTLHTNGATNVVNRIIDMFPGEEQNQIRTQLAESLRSVVWQALIPTPDGKSRVPACEILFKNIGVANLIREGKTHQLESALEMGQGEGMVTMRKYLEMLIEKGMIAEEEAAPFLQNK